MKSFLVCSHIREKKGITEMLSKSTRLIFGFWSGQSYLNLAISMMAISTRFIQWCQVSGMEVIPRSISAKPMISPATYLAIFWMLFGSLMWLRIMTEPRKTTPTFPLRYTFYSGLYWRTSICGKNLSKISVENLQKKLLYLSSLTARCGTIHPLSYSTSNNPLVNGSFTLPSILI